MILVGRLAVRQIQRRIREARVAPRTDKKGTTLVKRGHLLRSIRNSERGDSVIITAGGRDVPYARIHHEGGVIRPRNAQYLAIPLTPEAALYKPRNYPGETFVAKGVIFVKKDGGKPVPVYVLKKEVVMPGRAYMYLDEGDRSEIETAVRGWLMNQEGGR